jgi:hypothetical protein
MFRFMHDMLQHVPLDNPDEVIEEIATRVVREKMTAPAIVFLESIKPISFLGGQAAIVATPLLGGVIEPMRLERYADYFSDRTFIEHLIRRIEELDAEAGKGAKEEKSSDGEK